jgi:hypothetical protein
MTFPMPSALPGFLPTTETHSLACWSPRRKPKA